MRGLRSTIVLLVVLIGLGAYIYFVASKPSTDTGSKQEKLFAGLETDKIDEIKVKSESGDVTTVKKEGGSW
jgi:preprotein translocase subunit YajC